MRFNALYLIIPCAVTLTAAAALGCATCKPCAAAAEKGFVSLFDGKTSAGWRSRSGPKFPSHGWEIKEGVMTVLPRGAGGGGGDIITEGVYTNFVLKLDVRLSEKANSGIKYLFNPGQFGGTTLEYQILDAGHPDAQQGRDGNRRMAALYDMMPAAGSIKVKPIGEWNEVMLVVEGTKVEHWFNGEKVLAFDRSSAAFQQALAQSKYRKHKGWGSQTAGHILLQDHSDRVSYRNLRIKKLE